MRAYKSLCRLPALWAFGGFCLTTKQAKNAAFTLKYQSGRDIRFAPMVIQLCVNNHWTYVLPIFLFIIGTLI